MMNKLMHNLLFVEELQLLSLFMIAELETKFHIFASFERAQHHQVCCLEIFNFLRKYYGIIVNI